MRKGSLKAVILAGGFGTRLRPISYLYPKPMVPIDGKPFLGYLMDFLKIQGVSEFILCLHYMSEKFFDYFGDGSKFGFKITYNVEDIPLGTGGAIKEVEGFLKETFLVVNGDTYLHFCLQDMLEFHRKKENVATIALKKMVYPTRYGLVNVSADFRIKSFFEGTCGSEGYINVGYYIFEKKILDYIPKGKKISLEKEVLPQLLGKEKIRGFPTEGFFIDIGIPEDYDRFRREIAKGILS